MGSNKRVPGPVTPKWLRDLDRRSERLFRSLQTPKARRALEKAFRATPEAMRQAALREWKKKHRAQLKTKRAYASLARTAEKAAAARLKALKRCFQDLKTIDPKLAAAAVDTLGDKEHAAVWLGTSHQGLAGDSPYRAVATDRRDEVLRILAAIEHGFPV